MVAIGGALDSKEPEDALFAYGICGVLLVVTLAYHVPAFLRRKKFLASLGDSPTDLVATVINATLQEFGAYFEPAKLFISTAITGTMT